MRKRYICVRPAYGKLLYRSNCLLEAFAAKMSNWNSITIIYVSPRVNNGHPHFMWYDATDNNVYDFVTEKEKHLPLSLGYVKLRTLRGFLNWAEGKEKGIYFWGWP